MQTRISIFSYWAIVVATILLWPVVTFSAPLVPLSVPVTIVNQPKPYQESKADTCGGGNCLFPLSTVPPGTRRIIQNVSCVIPVFFSKVTFAELVNETANVTQFIAPTPIYEDPSFGPPLIHGGIFNAVTLMFFNAGQVPKIGFSTFNWTFDFDCMVSGYDVTLP